MKHVAVSSFIRDRMLSQRPIQPYESFPWVRCNLGEQGLLYGYTLQEAD